MIFELAGLLGVEPWAFTLRELDIMATHKNKSDWQHTSVILAMIANAHSNGKKVWTPKDFDPFAEKEKPIPADISVLKVLL